MSKTNNANLIRNPETPITCIPAVMLAELYQNLAEAYHGHEKPDNAGSLDWADVSVAMECIEDDLRNYTADITNNAIRVSPCSFIPYGEHVILQINGKSRDIECAAGRKLGDLWPSDKGCTTCSNCSRKCFKEGSEGILLEDKKTRYRIYGDNKHKDSVRAAISTYYANMSQE